jgi:hypothetical protein
VTPESVDTRPVEVTQAVPSPPKKPESRRASPQVATTTKRFQVRDPAAIARNNMGYVNIQATPRATEIYVDGQLLRTPDGRVLESSVNEATKRLLPAGTHQIVLKNNYYGVQWSGTVTVQRDKIDELNVILVRPQKP